MNNDEMKVCLCVSVLSAVVTTAIFKYRMTNNEDNCCQLDPTRGKEDQAAKKAIAMMRKLRITSNVQVY